MGWLRNRLGRFRKKGGELQKRELPVEYEAPGLPPEDEVRGISVNGAQPTYWSRPGSRVGASSEVVEGRLVSQREEPRGGFGQTPVGGRWTEVGEDVTGGATGVTREEARRAREERKTQERLTKAKRLLAESARKRVELELKKSKEELSRLRWRRAGSVVGTLHKISTIGGIPKGVAKGLYIPKPQMGLYTATGMRSLTTPPSSLRELVIPGVGLGGIRQATSLGGSPLARLTLPPAGLAKGLNLSRLKGPVGLTRVEELVLGEVQGSTGAAGLQDVLSRLRFMGVPRGEVREAFGSLVRKGYIKEV